MDQAHCPLSLPPQGKNDRSGNLKPAPDKAIQRGSHRTLPNLPPARICVAALYALQRDHADIISDGVVVDWVERDVEYVDACDAMLRLMGKQPAAKPIPVVDLSPERGGPAFSLRAMSLIKTAFMT